MLFLRWPPEDSDMRTLLPRCLRLFPHLQETGGFFVALLRKKCPLSFEAASPSPTARKPKGWVFEVPPQVIAAVGKALDLHPAVIRGALVGRSRDPQRLFLLTASARKLALEARVRTVSSGVPVLKLCSGTWKIENEGASAFWPLLPNHRVLRIAPDAVESLKAGTQSLPSLIGNECPREGSCVVIPGNDSLALGGVVLKGELILSNPLPRL